MKLLFLFSITLIGLTSYSYSQQSNGWDKWKWVMGEWKGEGNGQPGQGSGSFSFKADLNEKVLVRKSHSEYPAKDNTPEIIHEDLMIVYLDFSGNPSKAIYFDNEGHTINYSISYSDKNIVLLSDKIPNVPIFRLTYTLLDDNTMNTKFEMSQDGEKFMTYIEGKSKKIK